MAGASIDAANANVNETGALRSPSEISGPGLSSAAEAVHSIFGLIHELVGLRICVLTSIDLAANSLTVVEASDRSGLGVARGMVLPADGMPCGTVVRSGTPLRESDLDAHPIYRVLPACTKFGLRSYISVPLMRGDGSAWGTLAATDTELRELSDAHVQTLGALARLAVLEYEREEQRDALTAHAAMLSERLAMAKALEAERLRAVRLQTVIEAAATVSHEIINPLTVLQLRLGRLLKRHVHDVESSDDLDTARDAAEEIKQVTVQLRSVVQAVSTHYLAGKTRMIDLAASTRHSEQQKS